MKTSLSKKADLRNSFLRAIDACPEKEFYSVAEMAKGLGYHAQALLTLIKDGKLPAQRIRKSNAFVVPRLALVAFILKRQGSEPTAYKDYDLTYEEAKLINEESDIPLLGQQELLQVNSAVYTEVYKGPLVSTAVQTKEIALAKDKLRYREQEQKKLDKEKDYYRQLIASYCSYKFNLPKFEELCAERKWDSPVGDVYRAIGKIYTRSYISNAIKGKEVSKTFVDSFIGKLGLRPRETYEYFVSTPKVTIDMLKKYPLNHQYWRNVKFQYERSNPTSGSSLSSRGDNV